MVYLTDRSTFTANNAVGNKQVIGIEMAPLTSPLGLMLTLIVLDEDEVTLATPMHHQ